MRKSTLIMVLLAVALGAAVWYFEFKREKPAEDAASEAKPIFTFKQEEVSALRITRGGETIALEKRGNAWRMTEPLDSAADAGAIESLLGSIEFGRVSKKIAVPQPASPDALKAYGLDAPGVTLEIKLKSGAGHKLLLGTKDFMGSNVYALVDSATDVALLPGDVLSSADKTALVFRERRISVFDEENLVRLRVKNEHGTLEAAKNAEGKWLVTEPAALKGREVESERILSRVGETRAQEILDSPTAADRAQLTRPAVEVELTAKDGSAVKVEFSGGEGDSYARSSMGPMLFKVARTVVDGLNFKIDEIVKKEEPNAEKAPSPESPAKKPK